MNFSTATLMESELPVGHAHDAFDDEGQLADPELRLRLSESVDALIERSTPEPVEAARC